MGIRWASERPEWNVLGKEAERVLSTQQIDVVVLDLGLPDSTAADAIKRAVR